MIIKINYNTPQALLKKEGKKAFFFFRFMACLQFPHGKDPEHRNLNEHCVGQTLPQPSEQTPPPRNVLIEAHMPVFLHVGYSCLKTQ